MHSQTVTVCSCSRWCCTQTHTHTHAQQAHVHFALILQGLVSMQGTHYKDSHVTTGFANALARPLLRASQRDDMSEGGRCKMQAAWMRGHVCMFVCLLHRLYPFACACPCHVSMCAKGGALVDNLNYIMFKMCSAHVCTSFLRLLVLYCSYSARVLNVCRSFSLLLQRRPWRYCMKPCVCATTVTSSPSTSSPSPRCV